MKPVTCARENDIVEAIVLDSWGDELNAHANECPVCRDLKTVAVAIHDERERALGEARVPTSGQVWWRASTRARRELAAQAARPITVLQPLAGACAAGVCAAVITLGWSSFLRPLTAIGDTLSRGGQWLGAAALSPTAMEHAVLSVIIVLGAGVILAPFVAYLLMSEE